VIRPGRAMAKKREIRRPERGAQRAALERALQYVQARAWVSAEGLLELLLEEDPASVDALHLLGEVCFAQGRLDEAVRLYDRALAIRPGDAALHYNRGNIQHALGRYEDALRSFDATVARAPDSAVSHYNRGNALRALGRDADALAAYDRAIALDAANADAHLNRGNALRALERDAEAVLSYDQAIALRPDHADAHWNRAWALLALGEYLRGWPEHEWRFRRGAAALPPPVSDAPVWRGDSDPSGKRVLVLSEQGAGDTIQFLRFVPLLTERGATILLELPHALRRLCAPFSEWAVLIDRDAPIPPHELQIPMASFPLAFRTTLESVPARIPYLAPDPRLAREWADRIGLEGAGLRVGLAWAGNPVQGSEPRRGVGLAACMPLLDVPGVRWFSLQVGPRAADLAQAPPGRIIDLADAITDYADTAAAIAQLDLVISSDTSVVHLAGALGKPVWVLLMFAADWRWLRGRSDSPWYPSARLFRQPRAGDWDSAVRDLRRALIAAAKGG